MLSDCIMLHVGRKARLGNSKRSWQRRCGEAHERRTSVIRTRPSRRESRPIRSTPCFSRSHSCSMADIHCLATAANLHAKLPMKHDIGQKVPHLGCEATWQ